MRLADKLLADIRELKAAHNREPGFILLTIADMKQLDAELSGFYASALAGSGVSFSFAGVPIELVQ
jgi:hypothetical protein